MRALVAAAMLLMAAAIPLRAQNSSPIQPVGTIAVADSGLLTFASGNDYLIVASDHELALYDVRDASHARDVVTLPLDNAPLALAATADFALAAVPADGPDDMLLIIAPDAYSKGGFGVVNELDVPKGTHQLALSPNRKWGLAVSDKIYTTMALTAADDIQISTPFAAGAMPIVGTALTNDSALLIFKGSNHVTVTALNTSSQVKPRPNALTLDGPATAIAVSDDGTLGAIALENNRLTLFDPATLKVIRTVTLEDGPVTELHFVASDNRRLLALKIDQRPAVMLLDASDPKVDALPGSIPVSGEARALAVSGAKLAISDAEGAHLYQLNAPNS